MKITFLGNFQVPYSSENHHARSLEHLGHEVIRFQENESNGREAYESAVNSDLFLVVHTHNWVTPVLPLYEILERLKGKTTTITYHLDLWMGIERQKDLDRDPFYRLIDYFFCTDKLMADWFNQNTKVKGFYIPAGVYHEEAYIHPDYDPSHFENDIIFVGSKGYHPEWSYRPKLINWLKDTYGNRFKHYGGDGLGTIRGDALNRLYARSKIAIGDTLCINYDYPYYFSDRLFESTGRGAFTIFPYIKGLEDNFMVNKEIIDYQFNNFEELRVKIDYYLFFDKMREEIRMAGHERTKKDHTYINRWKDILKLLEENKHE